MERGIGIIGVGTMGADHVRRLAARVAGANPVCLTDANPDRAREVADEVGASVVQSGSGVIRDPAVDALIIASPDPTHFPLVMECIDAAKPVLCEKPLAATVAEAASIVQREIDAGRRYVQVGFMRRFDPGYRALREIVQSGRLGNPLIVHCVHRNRTRVPYWKSEMSILAGAVHEIDLLRWLLGEEYVSGQAISGRQNRENDPELKDPQIILLETSSGIRIDIEMNMNSGYGYDIQCDVVCESGIARLPDRSAVETRVDGQRAVPVDMDYRSRFADAYDLEMQAWVDSLKAGQPTGPGAWDGYVSLAVGETLIRSLDHGSIEPISTDSVPDLYS